MAIDFDNITKKSAIVYAKNLGRMMNYLEDEGDMDNLLFHPYALG